MTKDIQGYILNKVAYKENDLIVTILTKNGLDSFKVRGGLKVPNKFSNILDLYSFGDYTIYFKNEGDKACLKEGKSIEKIDTILNDIKLNTFFSFLAESIIKDPEITKPFELFDSVFKLKEKGLNYINLILIILKYHLSFNGSYLESDGCVKCGKKNEIVTVSFKEGGYLCYSCNQTYSVPLKSEDYLKAYRIVMKAKIINSLDFQFDEEVYRELLVDMFDVVEENTGIKFKTKEMILTIF